MPNIKALWAPHGSNPQQIAGSDRRVVEACWTVGYDGQMYDAQEDRTLAQQRTSQCQAWMNKPLPSGKHTKSELENHHFQWGSPL